MEEKRTGTVIIEETEYAVIGGGRKAAARALRLAAEGKQVVILAEGTCLAEDLCGANRYDLTDWGKAQGLELPEGLPTPDLFQRALEEKCAQMGITFLYFVKYVDKRRTNGKILLRIAGKGGLYGVLCSVCEDCRERMRQESDTVLVTREGQAGYELLTAPSEAAEPDGKSGLAEGREERKTIAGEKVELSVAQRLLQSRQRLVSAFLERRREDPALRLGRFARHWYGASVPAEEAGTLHEADRIRFFIPQAGQNRFGRYRLYAQPEEETAVAAAEQNWDVIVAGGGTAGVMAALHAARGGMKTLLLEPNYELGGTQTAGGVSTYWFGERFSDVREIDQQVEALCQAYGVRKREGIWSGADDFHGGLRSLVYLQLCLQAGVEVRFGQLVYGALTEQTAQGRRITGVLSAGEDGNRADNGRVVIDATGDGDVAVFAGAGSCYGSERDLITYWGSLAQYTSADGYRNNFSSMLFAEDPLDYSRFIRLGRKRGEQTFDHGSYVSMRESRHIRGVRTVTLKDLILFRTYEDGLYTCYSNYDPKGKLDADMVYCGVLPPQGKMQIPLSALLSVDETGARIRGLYVAGKAISVTHNGFPGIRMQPDLMHQGAVLGALTAKALREHTWPEEMDAGERRRFLRSYTDDPLTLPEFSLSPQACAASLQADSRMHWVDVPFTYTETASHPALGLMAADAGEVQGILRNRLAKETDPKLRERLIGFALWHGMDDWTEELCARICQKVEASRGLPVREGSVMCAQLLPDHGVMPEVVYQLNQLGWSRSEAILKPFSLVLSRLWEGERDYLTIAKGVYHYIESFAYAAIHSGRKEFAPMLASLRELPELKAAGSAGESVDLMTERYQILLLMLNRALASLGEREGYEGLAVLCSAANMAIGGSAQLFLQKMLEKCGQKKETLRQNGMDARRWKSTIEACGEFPVFRMEEKVW